MTIRYDGIDCNCGRKGCFEAYASASALVRQAAEAAEAHPDSRLHALVEGYVSRMNGKMCIRDRGRSTKLVADAFQQGGGQVDAQNAEHRKDGCRQDGHRIAQAEGF